MVSLAVLDELNRLLDVEAPETVNTSMRLPVALRDAAALAVRELGLAANATALTAAALRQTLETAVIEAALEHHLAQHPAARPSLAEIALALAEQDGSPLAEHPERIARAAEAVAARRPDPNPHDVLLWAEAQDAATA